MILNSEQSQWPSCKQNRVRVRALFLILLSKVKEQSDFALSECTHLAPSLWCPLGSTRPEIENRKSKNPTAARFGLKASNKRCAR